MTIVHILNGSAMQRVHSIINGAMADDRTEIIAALREDPECINDQDDRMGITAMHIAAADGNLPLVEFLLAQPGCDASMPDHAGRMPSELAYVIGRDDILHKIVEHGQRKMAAQWDEEEAQEARQNVVPMRPSGFRPPQP